MSKTNGQNPSYGCKKQNESTAALFYIVVTMTPALAMQITLNGSNPFITKLINKQKKMVIDAITDRKSTTSATPV